MTPGLGSLLAYSLQIAIVVLMAQLAASATRVSLPRVRLAYWRGVGLTCLALPFLPVLPPEHMAATVTFGIAPTPPMAFEPSSTHPASMLGVVLTTGLAVGLVIRLLLLGFGLARLQQMRRQAVPMLLSPALRAMRDDLAPGAELRWSDRIGQPVAFGLMAPVVLLPRRCADLDVTAQQVVACHELTHIARGDWAWIVAEEIVRAIFWFHPAIAWVLSQVHLNREQVVDDLVVRRTGARRAYMRALMAFADSPSIGAPAVALLRRHHLAARIGQLSKEVSMSRMRILSALCLMTLVIAITAQAVLTAMPADFSGLAAQADATDVRLEIRRAERQQGPGLTPVTIPGSGERIFLHDEVLAGSADVVRTSLSEEMPGRYSIVTEFSSAAASRLRAATAGHIGRPVAILLNRRVIAAPILRSPIDSSAMITGNFTRAEAQRIATALAGPRRAASEIRDGSAPAQTPLRSTDPGVVLPKVLTQVKPAYPLPAMDAKIMGEVGLSAVVTADGGIDDVRVTRSLDTTYGLDQSAVDSVKQWTFAPATRDGQPVPVSVDLIVTFTLK